MVSLAAVNLASASTLETLIMPGPVIEGHAKYETECTNCHARLRDVTQRQLCLDCHKDVRADVDGKTGFHGRFPGLAQKECSDCHTDHLGRNADIVRFNRETFDHRYTDFALQGAHLRERCESCHVADKAFREAPKACVGCHKDDDPHRGRLGEKCQSCHTSTRWSEVKFDHGTTHFALEGKHQSVSCQSCHAGERYKDTPKDCNSCHALNDVHQGRNGTKCQDCHVAAGWKKTRFDHDRDTKFALRGGHRGLVCEACHVAPAKERKLPTDCYGCHRGDDVHLGRNGRKCESCHSETSWGKARFDHARETDFPLRGKHEDLVCAACHKGDVHKDKLENACFSCHKADDVHKGQQGERCERCHQESGWGEKIVFDHDLTRFPLIGLHAAAPCEACHLSGQFKDAPRACSDCHARDDAHKRALGPDCAQCHNPNAWSLWVFDHDTQTDYRLEGGHRGIACASCHTDPVKNEVKLSRQCQSCHQQDDAHRGRFGQNCERCHTTDSFRDVRIQR